MLVLSVVVGLLTANGESLSFAGLSDVAGPFEGVDRAGHAFYLLKLGNAGKIPVYACWSSEEKPPSPLLGEGWDIPFLSSRIYPVSSTCLRLHLPDGYVRHFHRDKEGVYRGGRFWTASIDGNTTRVVADSGDGYPRTSLVFFKGRLTRMDCAEGVFDFKHDPRTGWTVLSKGTKLLAAVPDSSDEHRVQIRIGDTRLTAVRAQSLASLSSQTGEHHAFSSGSDGSNAWLEIDGDRLVWDLGTRQAVSWKGASFTIGPTPKDGVSGPEIARLGPDGRRETHAYDVRKGVETASGANGVSIVTRYFTSGDNAGKVRWRERHEYGACVERIDYIYDGAGRLVDRLVRETRN